MRRRLPLLVILALSALAPGADSVRVPPVPAAGPGGGQGPAPREAKPGPSKAESDEAKWYDIQSLLGRLEAEYDRLEVVMTEIQRLKNTAEDLATVQLYPEHLTGLKDREAVAVDKMIRRGAKKIEGFEGRAKALQEPLIDAIGMLKSLIYEDPQPEMVGLLTAESKERVGRVILLKRELNALWKGLDGTVDTLYGFAAIPLPPPAALHGFDAEFFQVLYSNLGLSSDLFFKKLGGYKDLIVARTRDSAMAEIANMDLFTAIRRFKRGEFALVERDLLDLARRFDQKIVLNGVYFYLGQVSQALGKHKEAVGFYTQVAQGSSYYLPAFLGELEAQFAMGKHTRVTKLYEKFQGMTALSPADLNRLIFVAIQSYYALKLDKPVVDAAAMAKKNAALYPGILYVLGQSYAAKNDFVTAHSIYNGILNLSGVREEDRKYLALSKMALAHFDFTEKRYPEALKQYLTLLDRPDLFTEALEGMAWCYLSLGQYDKAEIALKKLVNQAPWAPLGCEALLTLSRNYLKKARLEWQYKLETMSDAGRVASMMKKIDQRLADGEIDTARHAAVRARLDTALAESQKGKVLKFEEIDALFERANEGVDLLVSGYQSGEFIQSRLKSQRQETVLRIQDLHLKSKATAAQLLAPDYFAVREERKAHRRKILDTVVRARMFKVELLLSKQEWEREYGEYFTAELDRRVRELQAAAGTADSTRRREVDKLKATKARYLNDLADKEELERKEILSGLLKLRESDLTDEQEPFVLYYLGEIYYRMAQDAYLRQDEEYERQASAYSAALDQFEAKTIKEKPVLPVPPRLDYGRAKALFRMILEKYPATDFTDGALYSLLFCHSEEGDRAAAVEYGEALVREFPKSQYAPQTYLVLGEYYFDENKLDLALAKYREVLKFPDSRWFDKALYKIGWTYYRLSEPSKSISYFTFLVNEQDGLAEGGMDLELFTKSLLTKEAVDYISISFAESDTAEEMTGLRKAKEFVRKIKNPYIGSKIIHKLGDVYRDQLKYDNAITTYRTLREMYPNYREMPKVWYGVIEGYEQRGMAGDYEEANRGRLLLFKRYNRSSEWAQKVGDSVAVAMGDSIAEQALLEAASYTYSRALEKKEKDLYRQVIDMYWDYIKTYPNREKAGECHYYIAEILFGTGDYLEAARQYMAVSRNFKKSKYAETAAMNAIVAAQNLVKMEEETDKKKEGKRDD